MSIMFPAPSPGREGEVQLTVRDFPGPLKYHTVAPQLMQLVAAARQFAAPTAEIVALGEGKEGQEDAFQTECVDSNRLCVIGLFNTDSPLDQLKRVAAKWLRGGQFVFMWLDSGRHKALASRVLPLLGVSHEDLPTAVCACHRSCRALQWSLFPHQRRQRRQQNHEPTQTCHLLAWHRAPTLHTIPAAQEFDLADIMSEQVEDADAVASKEHKILQVEDADAVASKEHKILQVSTWLPFCPVAMVGQRMVAMVGQRMVAMVARVRAAMGVQGLWELLAPVGRRVSVEALANKTVAVDASIWLVQFLKAMRDDRGELLPGAHLLGFRGACASFSSCASARSSSSTAPLPRSSAAPSLRAAASGRNAQINLRRTAEKLLLNQLRLRKLEEAAQEMQQRGRGRA
ncbi:unnamed protein product, partial [Closterium sp. NIES-64]